MDMIRRIDERCIKASGIDCQRTSCQSAADPTAAIFPGFPAIDPDVREIFAVVRKSAESDAKSSEFHMKQ
jgi:hypothetical protein